MLRVQFGMNYTVSNRCCTYNLTYQGISLIFFNSGLVVKIKQPQTGYRMNVCLRGKEVHK